MYIPNNNKQTTFSGVYLKSLDTASFEPTNQNLIRVPKVFKPTNKRARFYQSNLQSIVHSIPCFTYKLSGHFVNSIFHV